MARKGSRYAYRGLALCLTLALIGGLGYAVDVAKAQTVQPDIILLLTDDQRYDTLFVMPEVQALQDKGVTYSHAIATNPLCCPSRTSILTGNYSHTTNVMRNESPGGGFSAFDDSTTIATELDKAGYHTGLVGKYLNGYPNEGYVPPGWDEWIPSFTDSPRLELDADEAGQEAVQFLGRHTDEPEFLYWAVHDPHMPAIPLDRYKGTMAGYKYPNLPSFNEADVSDKPGYIRGIEPLSQQKQVWLRERTQRQLETLRGVDEAIGRIVQAQEGRGRPALIIFTSDNGYAFGEHRWTVKVAPYEESIRVPLVVVGLGLPPGTTVDSLVAGIDLAPTIAEYAGIDFQAEGQPLESIEPGNWLMLEHREEPPSRAHPHQVPSYCGVRTEQGMYVRYRSGFEEFYNLLADPYQLHNRSGTDAFVAHRRLATQACVGNLPPDMRWR